MSNFNRLWNEQRSKLVKYVNKYLKAMEDDTSFKGLVYCQSKVQVERIVKLTRCILTDILPLAMVLGYHQGLESSSAAGNHRTDGGSQM